jgi:hypothetical protein
MNHLLLNNNYLPSHLAHLWNYIFLTRHMYTEEYAGPNEFTTRTVCLKIPKGSLKAVNWRRTLMVKRKRTKGLTMIDQKPKICATQTSRKTKDEVRCYIIVSRFCSNSGIRHVTFVTNPLISYKPGQDRIGIIINWTYLCWFLTQIFRHG